MASKRKNNSASEPALKLAEITATRPVAVIMCSQALLTIDGKVDVIGKGTVGRAFADMLMHAGFAGKYRAFRLCRAFSNEESVTVDRDDVAVLRSVIENDRVYEAVLVPGQLIEVLDDIERSMGWKK